MHTATCLLLLVGFLLVAGCRRGETTPAAEDVIKGHYRVGFETSELRPCGSDERMWVTGAPDTSALDLFTDLHARYQELTDSGAFVFVRVRGTVSAPGSYGHLDAYTHEFALEELLEMRASRVDDCR